MNDDFEWKGHNPNDEDDSSEDDLDLSWRRDDSDKDQPDDNSERTGVTGLLDWKKTGINDDPFSDSDDADFPDIDWDTPEGEQSGGPARTGVTGALSWLQDHEDAFERQLEEAERAAQSTQDALDHVDDFNALFDEPDAQQQPTETQNPDDDLPDWLIDDAPDRSTSGTFESFAPDDTSFDEQDNDDDDDIPDWLIIDEPSAPPSFESFAQDDASFNEQGDDDIPDWLIIDEPSAPPTFESFAQDDASFDDQDDDDIPDWLTAEDDLPHQDPFVKQPVNDVPDWLQDDTPEEPAQQPSTSSVDELPDWLQELPSDEPQAGDDPFLSSFADTDDDSFSLDDLEDDSALIPSFDNFSEDDFSAEVSNDEEDFDLFNTSSGKTGLTGMLGEVDLGDEDDGDSFDLFGELAGDEAQSPFSFDEPEESADDAFNRLFGGDDDVDTPIADSVEDDEDFLREARSLGFGTREFDMTHDADDDPFRDAFFDQEPQISKAADPSELDWLSGVSDRMFDDRSDIDYAVQQERANHVPDRFASDKPSFADVDDFLASLDDEIDLPTTQSGLLSSDDVDFDTLFGSDDGSVTDDSQQLDLSEDAPDWLVDLSEGAVGAGTAAALARQTPDRPVDELDNRLKNLRERGLNLNIKNVTGDTPAIERIIPGVSNTLPAVVFDPGEVDVTTDVLLTEEQRTRTAILRDLTGAQETSQKVEPRRRYITDRLLIGLLLLLITALPFVLSNLDLGDNRPHQFMPDSIPMTFYQTIEQVRAGDHVLIASELGSAGGAELDHATSALIRHIWARGGMPVVVSGNPIGLLRTDRLLTTLAEENNLIRNQDYFIGSYLVGDAVGLRNFAENVGQYTNTDVEGNTTGLNIQSLDDFRMIVVLVEDAERARAWGEQITPLTRRSLIALTSQSAAPLSAPYFNRMMSGYQDGMIYESMVSTLIASDGEHNFMVLPTATPTPTATATPIPTETPLPSETPLLSPTSDQASDEPTADSAVITDQTNQDDPVEVDPESTQLVPTQINTSTPTVMPTATQTPEPTSAPTETPLPAMARMAVISVDSAVNVRSQSNVGATAVGALRVAERALIIGEETNEFNELWYQIRFFNVNGLLIEGWIRSDLVTIETTTGNIETYYPTPTPQTSTNTQRGRRAVFAKVGSRSQTDPSDETASPTPKSIYDYNIQIMRDAIDAHFQELEDNRILGVRPLERTIQPPTMTETDARWDSITLGLLFAIVVITSGSVFNVLRALRHRNRNFED